MTVTEARTEAALLTVGPPRSPIAVVAPPEGDEPPPPIDRVYVFALLDELRLAERDLRNRVVAALTVGKDVVELADLVHDVLAATERAAWTIGSW